MTSKAKISGILLLLMSLTINMGSCSTKPAVRDISDTLLDNVISFSMQSGGEILTKSEDNEIYSPIGLYSVLSVMTTLTSEDCDSYLELSEALQTDKESIENEFITLTKDIKDSLKKCKVTNSLWYDNKDNVYNVNYLKDETKKLGVSLKEEDFALNGPSKFAGFIKDSTNGLINPNPSDFEYMRSINFALLNTLYYDGEWNEEFKNTHNVEFTNDKGEKKYYNAMSKEEQVYTYDDTRVNSIRMDYKDGAYMILFKPRENDQGLIEESLNDILLDYSYVGRILNHYRDEEAITQRSMTIDIPKFKTESSFDLNNHIKEDLGVNSIFNLNNKEFSPILNTGNVFMMTEVKQMSYIEVDEKGTKVASATFSFGCGANSAMPTFFSVDRPTAYIIVSETDIPLFMGTIRNV